MTIIFKPTGTTNYILSEFNTKTKDRIIYEEGGIPLHKIINYLYDFLYKYKNVASDNKIYYLHAIRKPEGEGRPETPVIMKLYGNKSKLKRINEYNSKIEELINDIDYLFSSFITIPGRVKGSYRTDTNPQHLLVSYKDWNNNIKQKITNLCT